MTRMLTVVGPCRWGEHVRPEPAHLERYHPDRKEWLPTCRAHLTSQRCQPVATYGRCSVCTREVKIRTDGTWPRHNVPIPIGDRNARPRPCGAAGFLAIKHRPEHTASGLESTLGP